MKNFTLFFLCGLCLWTFGVAAQEKTNCLIKGIIGPELGLKIYLLPGHYLYEYITVYQDNGETWFCSEAEAKQAGFIRVPNTPPKASKVPTIQSKSSQGQRPNPSESQKTAPTSTIHKKDAEFLKSLDAGDITESQRKQIFTELVHADDKALEESGGLSPKYDELLTKYETEVIKKYNITSEQIEKIKTEGLIKEWIDQLGL